MATTDLPGADDAAENAATRNIHKANTRLHDKIDQLSSSAHEGVDKVTGKATATAEAWSDRLHRVTETPEQALEAARDCVREKPLQYVAIAAGIGVLVGLLCGARHHSRY
ncbi:DUF883 family protein [Variovorax sp. VNK109]|uniref:DUF883 family protein n=1 Tax=Variovorax sp. VNK109 TaxID=3400919 RepID=UPI003C0CBB85